MADDLLTPSKARILAASIQSYDGSKNVNIAPMITEVLFEQSVDSGAYTGYIKMVDGVSLLERFPLRGEERLSLTVISNDLEVKKELDLQIYKIDNILMEKDANDVLVYYAHFVSVVSFQAMKRRIIQSFRDILVSDVALEVFSKYFSETGLDSSSGSIASYSIENSNKSFIVEQSQNSTRCVIPNYTPFEAMDFLTSRVFAENSSCSFCFFETLDDYYFVSYEYLIKRAHETGVIKKLTYYPVVSKEPADIEQQITNIEKIEIPSRVNTAADIYSGAYTNRVIEIDLTRKRVRNLDFKYTEDADFVNMDGENNKEDTYIHTERFMEDVFTTENARRFIVYRDYSTIDEIVIQLPQEQFLSDIASNRVSYQYHLSSTVLNARMKGRLDIRPGDIIDLDILEITSADDRGKNPQLSGKYLVHSTKHLIVGEELNTSLKLLKYGWSV